MHDITTRAPRPQPPAGLSTERWVREWWLWPLALLTLGWSLMLGAYAWNLADEQRKAAAPHTARGVDKSPPRDRATTAQPRSMQSSPTEP